MTSTIGLSPDSSKRVLLQGVTGSAAVPTVQVDRFAVGDLEQGAQHLPIVSNALGGADGVLGTRGMQNRRVDIDFRHDLISIERSKGQRATAGFCVIPFDETRGYLILVQGLIDGVSIRAIIDTGGEITVANSALRDALRRRMRVPGKWSQVEGITTDVQDANMVATPPLLIACRKSRGDVVEIRYHDVSYGDLRIFEHWHMTREPTMLVGMDALGLLDRLIIDYRLHELQIR
jgi:hypothetical protein